jgi:hypothetical protein
LRDCEDDLGEDLLDSAYHSKLPPEFLAYGRELLAKSEALAQRYGLDPRNLVVPDDIPTIEGSGGSHPRRLLVSRTRHIHESDT